MTTTERKTCPECGHVFKGNGWDGIDAHWKSKHENVMPYEEAWPLLSAGRYFTAESQTKEKPMRNPNWTRDELILALRLYKEWDGNPPGKSSAEIIGLRRRLAYVASKKVLKDQKKFPDTFIT